MSGPEVSAAARIPFAMEVVERGSDWPVPLVEFRTTHQVRFVSDNAGRVAFDLPELMEQEVWLEVSSPGYERPKDGFGYRGVRVRPQWGGRVRIEVDRTSVARRLGRLTGAGLFAESQKLGLESDWKETGILGCDSVQTAVWGGVRYWFWGDSNVSGYPLGVFDATGATSAPVYRSDWRPPLHLELSVIHDGKGRPAGVAPMGGEGPTWLSGVLLLPDRLGADHLVCAYMKVKRNMEAYEWGLAEWESKARRFRKLTQVWTKAPEHPAPPEMPSGHAIRWHAADGRDWVLFAHPFPRLRCPATYEAWKDPGSWEALKMQGSVAAAGSGEVVKVHDGVHSGGMAWNGWRQRWVTVFMQSHGRPSAFGELWYAEAVEPTGPWGPAVKVLSHDNYTFYNPCLHQDFTGSDSSTLLFEGTYTTTFADRPVATARYDYNQILYQLDLKDLRLRPAQIGGPAVR